MRLVKRQELMTLPSGTLFCELHQEWVFGGLQLKEETIVNLGKNIDFWVRQIDWPEANDTGEAIDRLEEMAKDSSVSYPIESAVGRHGLYDDERLYLVYEKPDADALVADLTPVRQPNAPQIIEDYFAELRKDGYIVDGVEGDELARRLT